MEGVVGEVLENLMTCSVSAALGTIGVWPQYPNVQDPVVTGSVEARAEANLPGVSP